MPHFLQRLRAKPAGERRRAAFFLALGLTIVIGVAWFASGMFLYSVGDSSESSSASSSQEYAPPSASSFRESLEEIRQEFSDFFSAPAVSTSSTSTTPVSTSTSSASVREDADTPATTTATSTEPEDSSQEVE